MSQTATTNSSGENILKRYRFSREDYHQLAQVGLLTEDTPVELINGEIIEMSPINSLHAGTVNLLNAFFSKSIVKKAIIHIQNPIAINEHSEPEPDLVVLKFREDGYKLAHPVPGEVLLLIEVADSSLEKDRSVKLPLYAKAGIPETWIVNLQDQQIEVYTAPEDNHYRDEKIIKPGAHLAHELFGHLVVKDILD